MVHGGIDAVAKHLGLSSQRLNNWKLRGRVPLEACGVVARGLGIKIWTLNYEQLVLLLGDLAPSWRSALKGLALPKDKLTYILAAKPPSTKSSLK